MKEVLESTLGTLFLVILMTMSLSCIAAAIDARHAEMAKTEYIKNIEDSFFDSDVIRRVFESAEEEGYQIQMTFYSGNDGDNSVREVANASEIGDTQGVYMVRMTLEFTYSFPLMSSFTNNTLLGYAK